jgi:hypothetical protein
VFVQLPLDDQLNRLFYLEGAPWRLVYASALGRCVYRREALHMDFNHAVELIAEGALLWTPPDDFERLDEGASLQSVRREQALLNAFLRSPVGHRIDNAMHSRLAVRLGHDGSWLLRHPLSGDDTDSTGNPAED